MRVAVRYYSKSGSTKKLADEIAKELGVKSLSVEYGITEDIDVLFFGCGMYNLGIAKQAKEFITNLNVNVGEVVTFSTYAITDSVANIIKKLASKKDIKVASEYYSCYGNFTLMHKGKPDNDDIKHAGEFAKKYINKKEISL